jgi:hypothetical protein
LAKNGPMAQLVAHLHGMQGVRGSNPLRSTRITRQHRSGAGGFLFAQHGLLVAAEFEVSLDVQRNALNS